MKRIVIFLGILVAGFIFLQACSNDDDASGTKGTLIVKMTDAPFPIEDVEEANITVSEIQLIVSEEEDENPIVLSTEEQTVNLLDLQQGVTETLSQNEVEAGTYLQLRFIVSEASILQQGQDQATVLTVPSGSVKVNFHSALEIMGGHESVLLLDFDVSKSFVSQGNANGNNGIHSFLFKPVVRAINQSVSGTLAGTVTDAADDSLIENALVSVIVADSVLTSGFSASNGSYKIIGLPVGTYSLTCEKEGYTTAETENVEITASQQVDVDFSLEADTITN